MNLVFDCDGVVLNSNRIKTEAFYRVAERFGKNAANQLVEFHVANGGISRYKKFEHLLHNILCRPFTDGDVACLAADYGREVFAQLMVCEVTPGLELLRKATSESRWFIVSGGDQAELRAVFKSRGLDHLFDGGIFGSPDTKDQILSREIESGNLKRPAVFLGDSRYDHQAATTAGLQFLFVSAWTEMRDWPSYCSFNDIKVIQSVSELDVRSL